MIEARLDSQKRICFDPPISSDIVFKMMKEGGDNTLVHYVSLYDCTFGNKDTKSANQYIIERIANEINKILSGNFEIKALFPLQTSNTTLENGEVIVNSLIFQIQYA